eukprot:1157998-Pelagomonas_calceolata.AAC.2
MVQWSICDVNSPLSLPNLGRDFWTPAPAPQDPPKQVPDEVPIHCSWSGKPGDSSRGPHFGSGAFTHSYLADLAENIDNK